MRPMVFHGKEVVLDAQHNASIRDFDKDWYRAEATHIIHECTRLFDISSVTST